MSDSRFSRRGCLDSHGHMMEGRDFLFSASLKEKEKGESEGEESLS